MEQHLKSWHQLLKSPNDPTNDLRRWPTKRVGVKSMSFVANTSLFPTLLIADIPLQDLAKKSDHIHYGLLYSLFCVTKRPLQLTNSDRSKMQFPKMQSWLKTCHSPQVEHRCSRRHPAGTTSGVREVTAHNFLKEMCFFLNEALPFSFPSFSPPLGGEGQNGRAS